jgi:hypothetical protein
MRASRFGLSRMRVSVLVSLGVIVAASATTANAATLMVNCTADPGALASALATASDGDTLSIQGTCKGTFEIAHSLTLAGAKGATLDGQAVDTVLTVDSAETVVVTGLTVTNGFATSFAPDGQNGGGIWNNGTLTLIDSSVAGNATSFSGNGAGIYNTGTLSLDNSTVSGNRNVFSGGGAGIFNTGMLTLSNSTVSGNVTALGQGGGIYSITGTLIVNNSTISGNFAGVGGGVTNRGFASIFTSSVSGNGVRDFGGGIANYGGLVLAASTVSENTSNLAGGGVYNAGSSLDLVNNTINANSAVDGGGVYTVVSAMFRGSIVAAQSAGGNCMVAGGGSTIDGGYNLDDGTTCGFSIATHSLPNTDPMLDPAGLADNGGPTETVALLAGSPAIDVIPLGSSKCGVASLPTDQRGVSRPQGLRCDIGAFEVEQQDSTPPVITVPGDITVNATSPAGAAVSYSVTAGDPDDEVASLGCVPASASTFAIGTTTVDCTASDTHGNTGSASFMVHVKGAAEQLADLRVAVTGVGPGTSLADKVIQAQTALNKHDLAGACSTLNALINQLKALSGKSVPAGVVDALVADATRIRAVLGC